MRCSASHLSFHRRVYHRYFLLKKKYASHLIQQMQYHYSNQISMNFSSIIQIRSVFISVLKSGKEDGLLAAPLKCTRYQRWIIPNSIVKTLWGGFKNCNGIIIQKLCIFIFILLFESGKLFTIFWGCILNFCNLAVWGVNCWGSILPEVGRMGILIPASLRDINQMA